MRLLSPRIRAIRAFSSALAVVFLLASSAFAQEKQPENTPDSIDTGEILRAVVGIETTVPANTRTARALGTERNGNGIIIDNEGLVLTIGYVILEADLVNIIKPDGKKIPAKIVGYDHNTGFGLVRALKPLNLKPIRMGKSADLFARKRVLIVSHEGELPVMAAQVVSRRPFAGYWEYLLDSAIYTIPPFPKYGGAALIGVGGRLLGVGSLVVSDAFQGPPPVPGNMFVPIDLLGPILADLLENGRSRQPSHPWLGAHTTDLEGRLRILRITRGGPADKAGLREGDIIMGVDGKRVKTMEDFFRKIWAHGTAGVSIPLNVVKSGAAEMKIEKVIIKSDDRYNWLKLKHSY